MSIFDFPALPVSKCLFVPLFNGDLEINKTSGHENVKDYPGERWVVQYQFKVLTTEEAFLLREHLSKLRGVLNKSRLYDTLYTAQRGSWGGTPVVDGANQYGLYVDARGFAPNQVVAKSLDRCLIGNQLMELSDDATANANGQARLYFTNELRNLTTDGMPITADISALRTIGRWTRPEQIRQLTGTKRLYRNITLDFVESFDD